MIIAGDASQLRAQAVQHGRAAHRCTLLHPQTRSTTPQRYLAIAVLLDRLKWTQYTRFGIEEDVMPEAPNDIDYTVDVGRHETMFRANTPKGENFSAALTLQCPMRKRIHSYRMLARQG